MLGTYHIIALALFAGFVVLELASNARPFPAIAHWPLKGIAATLLYFAFATFAPLVWDAWLGEHRLFAADQLPLWAQIGGGFVFLQLGIYVWHRTMHNRPFLWRWFHQMHHSAERVDIWGAFYFHPHDMIAWALLGSLVLVGGFGVGAEAAIAIGVFTTFLSMLQHANIRTPHWLGYWIVRPESHTLHHERGVHGRNYCDFPLIDMLFGTFANPRECRVEAGFFDGSSRPVWKLLAGKLIA